TEVRIGDTRANLLNGEPIPIWIADYVLISYGTGAIMAVPAHDERDFEFARQFKLPIVAVLDPGAQVSADERAEILAGQRVFIIDSTAINSGPYTGLPTAEFKQRIAAALAQQGGGQR